MKLHSALTNSLWWILIAKYCYAETFSTGTLWGCAWRQPALDDGVGMELGSICPLQDNFYTKWSDAEKNLWGPKNYFTELQSKRLEKWTDFPLFFFLPILYFYPICWGQVSTSKVRIYVTKQINAMHMCFYFEFFSSEFAKVRKNRQKYFRIALTSFTLLGLWKYVN